MNGHTPDTEETETENRYWEEELPDFVSLRDDGRSDGEGESYSERNT